MAFRKFSSRKGFPSLMLSDNATTFVAASEYLKTMADSPLFQNHLAENIECKWKFIPARAPWFGAIWERLIGLLKNCMKKVVGRALLSYDEYPAFLVELESIINDRPLSYTSGDLDQKEILTPNHLILGRKLRSFPKETINWEEVSEDPLYSKTENVEKRFLYISKLCDQLWKRWEHEYLISLRETHRIGVQHNSWPKIGDVVLVHDEGPRNKWKLGQVIQVHVGSDNVVRVATLKTSHGQIMRPIVKLYPLELWQEVETPDPAKFPEVSTRPSRKAARVAAETRKDLIQKGLL
ncbi:uncharacterized protein LOC135209088 [Macrobrachium nipponense]|uniref:uncharacterized protein LOC135209088 n=1 Tax=Macrobrachium nipponense TaxID=159736 RepID=UPI0030C80D76